MAILTTIAGVPLFTTVQEALNWAATNNCTGYHTHGYELQTGYMGCFDHSQASTLSPTNNTPTNRSSVARGGGMSGGSGGASGY